MNCYGQEFASKSEVKFPMVTAIWTKIWFQTLTLILTHKNGQEWIVIVSKIIHLIEISNFADKSEVKFLVDTAIWAKKDV